MAVRRYVPSRYRDLLAEENGTDDLMDHAITKLWKTAPLGRQLGYLRGKGKSDPVVAGSVALSSYRWLMSDQVNALNEIGKGSHNLCPPEHGHAVVVGDHLTEQPTDHTGWRDAGLVEPPVVPARSILTIWLAGTEMDRHPESIGQLLCGRGLPAVIVNHAGIDQPSIRARIFGTEQSLALAEEDAARLNKAEHPATADLLEFNANPDRVRELIGQDISADTAALLLVPTGPKPMVLTLLRAMRHLGAEHGIPLFVGDIAKKPDETVLTGSEPRIYLWPALTGGDLPLLVAAREALDHLEPDVAWRLLAASAIDPDTTERARQFANVVASREPDREDGWLHPDPAITSDPIGRSRHMAVQRLELVNYVLSRTTDPAERIRLLVLAADVLETSIANEPNEIKKRKRYLKFRNWLRNQIGTLRAARVLLILNRARDQAPITHGSVVDPDTVVANATDDLARDWRLPDDATGLPRTVAALLRDAIDAAAELGLGAAGRPRNLIAVHQEIDQRIDEAIRNRPDRVTGRPAGVPGD
jgi:hypothetical protein